jgi:hypothetical protein
MSSELLPESNHSQPIQDLMAAKNFQRKSDTEFGKGITE